MAEGYPVCRLLYIEDLDVYARTSRHLDQLIKQWNTLQQIQEWSFAWTNLEKND